MIRPSHSQITHTHTHTAAVPRNMGEETLGGKNTLCFSTCWLPALVPISSVIFSAFPPIAIYSHGRPFHSRPATYPTIDSSVQQQTLSLSAGTHSQQHIIMRCIFQLIKKQKDTTSQIPVDPQTHFSAPSHTKSLKGLKVSSSSFFPPVLSLASSNQTSGPTSPFKLALLRLQKTKVTFWSSPIPSETINNAYHPPLQLWNYLIYLICFFILSSLLFENSDSRGKCILLYPCHLKPCLANGSRYVILVEWSC